MEHLTNISPLGLQHLDLSDNDLSGEVFISNQLFDSVGVEDTKLMKRHAE